MENIREKSDDYGAIELKRGLVEQNGTKSMIQIPQQKFKGLSNVGLQVMNGGNNENSKSL
jgi:hypothetical protein